MQTYSDGFGHSIETWANSTSGGGTIVSTFYDPCGCSPLGKVSKVSQPYAPNGTVYWTTYTYDASGRTTRVALPDGSHTDYLYQGNTVKVTDPAGKWKTFTMDAFGNLKQVQETDPSLGTVTTSYTYDILNHLTQVSMPRGANTQTRTFNYIPSGTNTVGAFLLSATNPENGTVTYTYSNGLLASKTDAKGQVFTYFYDGYNRLQQIKVGGTVLRTFIYDTNSLDGSFTSYGAGRLVAVQNGSFTEVQSGIKIQFNEMYSYTQAGQPNKKRLQVNETPPSPYNYMQTQNLDAAYTYDTEGKMTSVNYPTWYSFVYPNLVPTAGPTYTYSFDTMSRPIGLTDQNSNATVSSVQYGGACALSNQMSSMTFSGATETRCYNALGQLTNLTIPGQININYNYPSGTNNGKISSQSDALSGETVTYAYDSLNRLLSASGSGWSETYGYDGFGSLVSKTPTGGAPQLSIGVNPANNQIVGQSYDANGNQGSYNGITLFYDSENHVLSAAGLADYQYDSQGKRIWKGTFTNGSMTAQEVYFYGVGGQKLGTYSLILNYGSGQPLFLADPNTSLEVYFGSKRLATQDRLGSVGKYYPYGEARTGTNPQDTWSFATYWRDSATSMDYADQRYYSNQFGRFMTPDPYRATATSPSNPRNPQSWNRYAYAQGDPINYNDPTGSDICEYSSDFCIDVWGENSSTWNGPSLMPWDILGLSKIAFVTFQRNEIAAAKSQLPAAIQRAIKALQANNGDNDCARLFGTAASRAAGFDPVKVLQTIYNSSGGGKVSGVLVRSGFILDWALLGRDAVTFVSPFSTDYFNGSFYFGKEISIGIGAENFATEADWLNAQILLHELGHVYNGLVSQGSGGSQIADDGTSSDISQQNTMKILKDCDLISK